jgi:hypothetical protein
VMALGDRALPIDALTHLPSDSFDSLLVKSIVWIAGILVVFIPLSVRLYRRLT